MFVPNKMKVLAASTALAFAGTSISSFAALERTGPVSADPAVGKFPAWYQDKRGITLEFCAPSAAELTDGSCLVTADAPGAPGVLAVPESLPANFFDEHFYYAAGATLAPNGTGKATLVLAEEAAFASGAAVDGQQIVFSRIRVLLNPVPVTGSYRFIHPYGEITLDGVAGGRIFFTDDVGATCTGDFTCALKSDLGPFLVPSAIPGGAELGPFAANGKLYLADPGRIGPVTGGLPGQNKFRIEGPAGSALGGAGVDFVETTDFTVMGRLFTGVLPGRVTVDRASYTNSATATNLDVFATAVPTTASRLPGSPVAPPGGIAPALWFYDRACGGVVNALDPAGPLLPPYTAPVGGVRTQMKAASELRWGQTHPAAIPAQVCVEDSNARDANGNVVSVFAPVAVKDEVTVTKAFFNPDARTLVVDASSSETVAALTLRLAYGALLPADLVNGQVVVQNLLVPPPDAEVQSTRNGITRYQVSSGYAAPAPVGVPVAQNDAFSFLMNGPASALNVTANDSNVPAGTVPTLTSNPTKGTVTLNPNGTVTYQPNLNTWGADGFSYTVTVAGVTSNAGVATINITPINVAPVAVNDSFSAIAGVTASLSVLANDTDVNGATNIVAPVNVTQTAGPAIATLSVPAGSRNVSFLAPAGSPAGNYTFTYRAQDAGINGSAPLLSNQATVTVAVVASETLAFGTAEYRRDSTRLRVDGTVTPGSGQTITVQFVDPGAAGGPAPVGTPFTVVSTRTTAPTPGTWALDTVTPLPVLPNGRTPVIRATTSNGTVLNGALTIRN